MTGAARPNAKPLTLEIARFLWAAFLCSACGIIAISRILKPQPHAAPSASFGWALVVVAAVDIVFFGLIRRNILAKSRQQAMQGDSTAAQASWSVAQLLGLAAAESIVLFGFVLSVLHGRPSWIRVALFAVGLLLMVSYFPQRPDNS